MTRFETDELCFYRNTYEDKTLPVHLYLRCAYKQTSSFAFFGGKFVGNGFAIRDANATQMASWVADNGVRTCKPESFCDESFPDDSVWARKTLADPTLRFAVIGSES